MKDQIVMSQSGHLGIAIPLYRKYLKVIPTHNSVEKYNMLVEMIADKPLAYVIDCGEENGEPQVFAARYIEENLEFLGDL